MMIRLVCFDLDGVLSHSRELHYNTLNKALEEIDPKYVIQREEHEQRYDALPTRKKLDMVAREKGLPDEFKELIFRRKQELTAEAIPSSFSIDQGKIELFRGLQQRGIITAVCSNTIRNNLYMILKAMGIFDYPNIIISNQDVDNPKPAPDMYIQAMKVANVDCTETLIVEDSDVGIEAAIQSGGHVLRVKSPEEVTYKKISELVFTYLGIY
jgi:beta-phosphoglucomutase